MDPFLAGLIGILTLFFLLVIGVHIGIALTISGFVGIVMITDFHTTVWMVVSVFYGKISSPILITLPLFILMGHLASGGGISSNLYNSLSMWFGKFRPGLGISTTLACTAFGTVCGASFVTAAVFAKVSAPEMRQHGYDKRLAYGIVTASGAIGMLIPPSILAIVYSMLSGVSTGKVLMAGIAPGILCALAFSVTIWVISKIRPSAISLHDVRLATWKERFLSLRLWWPVAIVGFIIFGGMYGGVFSPSEAAAVAAFVLILVYLFSVLLAQKRSAELGRKGSYAYILKDFRERLIETAITSAMIFLILGGSTIFSKFIVLAGITSKFTDFVLSQGLPAEVLVVLFILCYLILGCFMDAISNLSITVPIFNPIVNAAGIDPIWYATVVILSAEVGLITPPVGLNIYATKGAAEADVSLEDIIRAIFPFFFAMLACLVILYAFPPLSTFLPNLIF